jgi:signal transduction histidine kinase
MTTILKITRGDARPAAAVGALRDAGIGVIEVDDWDAASEKLRNGEVALVVCDHEALDAANPASIQDALGAIKRNAALAPDAARSLSHDLRTPLSAMAGWLHLMESGKLDEAGMKRAILKLRGNIDDQVRTIDRFLGTTNGGRS